MRVDVCVLSSVIRFARPQSNSQCALQGKETALRHWLPSEPREVVLAEEC